MLKGTIKWYNENKGYGFIVPDDGGDDVFVHRTGIETMKHADGFDDGDPVTYDMGVSVKNDKPCAVNVEYAG